MEAAQVVAVPETTVAVAGFPVARGRHTVQKTAVMQYRQVESRTVPRHQIPSELFQSIEKALDQVLFRRAFLPETPHPQRVPRTHPHRDRDPPMLLVGQEIRHRLLPPL